MRTAQPSSCSFPSTAATAPEIDPTRAVCHWLREAATRCSACRDPGSTRLGEAVREMLLDRHDLQIHRRSEMLLYMAARAQLVEELFVPPWTGQDRVTDRYLLANVVYQGYGGGLDVETLWGSWAASPPAGCCPI